MKFSWESVMSCWSWAASRGTRPVRHHSPEEQDFCQHSRSSFRNEMRVIYCFRKSSGEELCKRFY